MTDKSKWTNPPSKEAVEQAEKSVSDRKANPTLDEVEEQLSKFRERLFELSAQLADKGVCTCCIGKALVDIGAWFYSHEKGRRKPRARKLFLREAKDAIRDAHEVQRRWDNSKNRS